VLFIGSRMANTPVFGIRLDANGNTSFLPEKNAPSHGGPYVAVFSCGTKVLYWGYAHVMSNDWSVWDSATNAWEKPQEFERAYSFASCSSGNEVYVFGGAESSAFGWIKQNGWIYSFKESKWRPWPGVKEGPGGRRDAFACWTGKEVLVWGGDSLSPQEAIDRALPTAPAGDGNARRKPAPGYRYDPATEKWTPMSAVNAPPVLQGPGFWTGKELFLVCGSAYDPAKDAWRKLAEPKRLAPVTAPAKTE
jgi:hypothetical protein